MVKVSLFLISTFFVEAKEGFAYLKKMEEIKKVRSKGQKKSIRVSKWKFRSGEKETSWPQLGISPQELLILTE